MDSGIKTVPIQEAFALLEAKHAALEIICIAMLSADQHRMPLNIAFEAARRVIQARNAENVMMSDLDRVTFSNALDGMIRFYEGFIISPVPRP